ncbi:uncharacterized protein LOC129778058 [Toxorhynchites rutilus septentrionalis]|uniref:uncharacterized protein LOC129778058 n=1 Tax=Toxorhynchites rutilus septentrionalis TaxID=329112 RepID=UPI0024794408|nr:uncharacterized protein LOC129778058 [Toxorhynchites rutilus septentrionalis]
MSDSNSGRGNGNTSSINKRPRLLSFQGPSSESHTIDRPPVAAGPSSSSLEEINVRQQLADLRPEMASWQEAQITACIEDNTINMVLEQYLSFFEARQQGIEAEGVDQADREDMEHEQEVLVEDQAILAAINQRGLQPVQAFETEEEGSSRGEDDDEPGLVPNEMVGRRMDIDQHQGMDLLETAVVAAIQEKGLTSAGAQFGRMEEDNGS